MKIWGDEQRILRRENESIMEYGCNITKCGKSGSLQILSGCAADRFYQAQHAVKVFRGHQFCCQEQRTAEE